MASFALQMHPASVHLDFVIRASKKKTELIISKFCKEAQVTSLPRGLIIAVAELKC